MRIELVKTPVENENIINVEKHYGNFLVTTIIYLKGMTVYNHEYTISFQNISKDSSSDFFENLVISDEYVKYCQENESKILDYGRFPTYQEFLKNEF